MCGVLLSMRASHIKCLRIIVCCASNERDVWSEDRDQKLELDLALDQNVNLDLNLELRLI